MFAVVASVAGLLVASCGGEAGDIPQRTDEDDQLAATMLLVEGDFSDG